MAARIELAVGLDTWSITLPEERRLVLHHAPIPALPGKSPRELVGEALERPFGFEPLRRALTPDDRVALFSTTAFPTRARWSPRCWSTFARPASGRTT